MHPENYPMQPPTSKEDRLERFVQFMEMVCVDGVIDPMTRMIKLIANFKNNFILIVI